MSNEFEEIEEIEEKSKKDEICEKFETEGINEKDFEYEDEINFQNNCASELKQWIETEAKFKGRTTEDFLHMYLRGCKFNMDKVKKKMTLYYENRKKLPHWCANRIISDLDEVLQKKITILVKDSEPHLPTLTIVRYANYGADSSALDKIMKLDLITMEVGLRRLNSQMNGSILLIDCAGHPMWILAKFLMPNTLYNAVHCYLKAMPIRMKGFHVVNFPFIGRMIWHILKPLLPLKLRNRFHFYGSGWSTLKDNIDVRSLPEEYGGSNGPMLEHEEAFYKEIYSFSDYFAEDNEYGFL